MKYYGIAVPGLPPDDAQIKFTGGTGFSNLKQAHSFYCYVCSVSKLMNNKAPKILDFGGGWGRIARFFLKDTKPGLISVSDCYSEALHWLSATNNPCHKIKNDPFPPIAGLDADFDLIYSFSVFSHLTEKYQNAWVDYLLTCLRPGGYLIFTTRGHQFIEHLKHRHRTGRVDDWMKKMPDPQIISARYANGEFQFYPYATGSVGELDSEFYGEALIPRSYFERKYAAQLVNFTEDVDDVNQAVIVLQRPAI